MSPQNPTSRCLGREIEKGRNVPGAVRPFVYEIVSVLTTKLACEFKGYFALTYKVSFCLAGCVHGCGRRTACGSQCNF